MTMRQIKSAWFLWEYGPLLPFLVEWLQWFLYRVVPLEVPTGLMSSSLL